MGLGDFDSNENKRRMNGVPLLTIYSFTKLGFDCLNLAMGKERKKQRNEQLLFVYLFIYLLLFISFFILILVYLKLTKF